MTFEIRHEDAGDAVSIRQMTESAFRLATHSSGTEGAIVDALRASGALTISLVAATEDEIVGHAAFSPVTINGADMNWFGLGPVSVKPELQGQGIGGMLIRAGLDHLKSAGAAGCVVLGDPAYYRRFGFEHDPTLKYVGAPAEYFMQQSFGDSPASGNVAFHDGFSAC